MDERLWGANLLAFALLARQIHGLNECVTHGITATTNMVLRPADWSELDNNGSPHSKWPNS